MLRFIVTKIKNKFRLYLALLTGVIVMIAAFGMLMMLRKGSLDRLVQSEFTEAYEADGNFPAVISKTSTIVYEEGKLSVDAVLAEIESDEAKWDAALSLPVLNRQRVLWTKGRRAVFSYRGDSGYLDIGYIDDDYDGKHFELIDGTSVRDFGELPEENYWCYVDRHTMDVNHFVVGETLTMKELGGPKEDPVVFHIAGIIGEGDYSDYFWQESLARNGQIIYLTREDFNEIAGKHGLEKCFYKSFSVYDYRKLEIEQAKTVVQNLEALKEEDTVLTENLSRTVNKALEGSVSVKAVLYAIAVPLILLVLLFIGMIAVRIIDSEQGEIAMLHSRGMSRPRIVLIYLVQSFIIAAIAFVPGLYLGYGAGRLAASATGFLTFSGREVYGYGIYPGMIWATLAAAFGAAVFMLIPVIPRSKNTVVLLKSSRHLTGAPLWEKYFLDIVLLAVTIYLLFNYNRQMDQLKMDVLSGKTTDPMIFLTATFFLISFGLLILRLMSYLVRLIFRIGRNRFSPASYAALLQIIRTRRGSGVISVFLVLTIAMSIFNANMARTVSANKEARIAYDIGSDVVVSENWQLRVLSLESPQKWSYTEPDKAVYEALVKDGLADSVTAVVRDDGAAFEKGKLGKVTGTFMAISTKEFGETARLMDGLTEEHWFNYLNALGQTTNGVLISGNLAEHFELAVGDTINYSRYSPVEPDIVSATAVGTVVGIVDAFPGYRTTEYITAEDGTVTRQENYLLVANYGSAVNIFDKTPYDIWIRTSHSAAEIRTGLEEKFAGTKRTIGGIVSVTDEVQKMQDSSMIKITNGLFTVNVLLALLLSLLGYLIHWITSIRDRELLFGIYRAMGISMGEVSHMLTLEQLFLSLGPFLAGIGAGSLATVLFAKVFSVVYLPENHAVELSTYTSGMDFLRIGIVIGTAVILCFFIIRSIIRRMKVTEALKLGED